MKKLLVLALVLSMATLANAALTLSVDKTAVLPSENVTISISGDGQTDPGQFFLTMTYGEPGSFNIENAQILYIGNASMIALETGLGYASGGDYAINEAYINFTLNDLPSPGNPKASLTGLLVQNIIMHCEGAGSVTLQITDADVNPMGDAVVITQTPEPITIGLLGLGAMFLRRRK